MASSIIAGLVFSTILSARYSRACEKEADLGSVQLMGNTNLAESLQKLDFIVKKYLPYTHWQMKNVPSIFASHPPIDERIEYIQKAAKD